MAAEVLEEAVSVESFKLMIKKFLKFIPKTKNQKIVERLNYRIFLLERDLDVYKRYKVQFEIENAEEILKELKYIKTGKGNKK